MRFSSLENMLKRRMDPYITLGPIPLPASTSGRRSSRPTQCKNALEPYPVVVLGRKNTVTFHPQPRPSHEAQMGVDFRSCSVDFERRMY